MPIEAIFLGFLEDFLFLRRWLPAFFRSPPTLENPERNGCGQAASHPNVQRETEKGCGQIQWEGLSRPPSIFSLVAPFLLAVCGRLYHGPSSLTCL